MRFRFGQSDVQPYKTKFLNNYFDDRTIKSELGFDDILIKPSFTSIEPIDIDLSTKLTRKIKLKIPIISTPMSNITESDMALALANEGGLGVIHRYMTIEDQINQIKKVKSNDKITAASVGVNDKERAIKISKYTDVLFIETTSASNKKIFNFVKDLTKQISCDVVVGNFGTSSNIEEYCDLGISGIKVGVGVGSICTLQKITGVGRPQISALIDIFNTVRKYKMPVIADGGIRSTGDIVKALAAGADSVMIGYILSGTKETPGKIVKKENKKYKEYNGTLYSFVEIEKDYLETDLETLMNLFDEY